MSYTNDATNAALEIKCAGCGAILHYAPGTGRLQCTYCGTENAIDSKPADGTRIDYNNFCHQYDGISVTDTKPQSVKCGTCGASSQLDAGITSDVCPFCATPLMLALAADSRLLRPHAVLPFQLAHKEAKDALTRWVGERWFAPGDLKATVTGQANRLRGCYYPHWLFDTDTTTRYKGERGDYYYTTETYTTVENGQQLTKTRQVRHTRWSSASGTVRNVFVNLLVSASATLDEELSQKLDPWDFPSLTAFDERFLSGFRSETFQVTHTKAFGTAKGYTEATILSAVQGDIGGDEQRVHSLDTRYFNTALAYVLLPVWMCTYKHGGKTYRVAVNARTGEVIGTRPYSAGKIFLFVLVLLALAAGIWYWASVWQNTSQTGY